MKIGIISDSHDRIENTKKAIIILKQKGCSALIHCGDLCAPFMIDEIAKFGENTHCIFGNIDDRFNTPIRAKKLGVNFHGDTAKLEFEGRKIAVNHYPDIAKGLASTNDFDAVFYGHDHTPKKEKIRETLLLNPGGLWSRNSDNKPSIAIYDTKTNDAEFLSIE